MGIGITLETKGVSFFRTDSRAHSASLPYDTYQCLFTDGQATGA